MDRNNIIIIDNYFIIVVVNNTSNYYYTHMRYLHKLSGDRIIIGNIIIAAVIMVMNITDIVAMDNYIIKFM